MRHCFLTGSPGVGKSTLVEKVVNLVRENAGNTSLRLGGFVTREVREGGGGRTGFKVVTLSGKEGVLAAVDSGRQGPKVGKFTVDVTSFEKAALPELDRRDVDVLVIDEIGKMELFSKPFVSTFTKILDGKIKNDNGSPIRILGTVALKGGGLIASIKEDPNVDLLVVDESSRDTLLDTVVHNVFQL
eukprot:GFYU01002576.1.p1 GENE.GFYU01002576.1~~GFYU01002576.1.p1  ORF type:complete len:201 (-),score=45.15 GFYU01002576.1:202-762(-)